MQHGVQNITYHTGPDGQLLFERWEEQLRRLPQALDIAEGDPLALERTAALQALVEAVRDTAAGQVMVVRGEPGVGKSSLILRAADALRAEARLVLVAPLGAMRPHAGALVQLLGDVVGAQGAPPSGGLRGVLVLDGAEAAQDGLAELCVEGLGAAVGAGLTPVLVCRDDAWENVRELAGRISSVDVAQMSVPPLTDEEIGDVLAAAPQLLHLASQARSRWLLRRLLIIDLLLRSARRGAGLPEVLASEADVYTHVWVALVLNQGRSVQGVAPDDRAAVLVSLAEERLAGRRAVALPGAALAALRSDGLLAPLGPASAVSAEEHRFAHDVYRDFATVRRLLLDGGIALLGAHGPRWAVRAARIFCQIRLGPGAAAPLPMRWLQVHATFRELAGLHGSRWEEIPWEAVLAAGWCGEVLAGLTGELLQEPALLAQLLRCAARLAEDGLSAALITAPVVSWLVEHTSVLTGPKDDVGQKVVLEWLRSVALQEVRGSDIAAYRSIRVALRDAVLRSAPAFPSETFIEALALLGADCDDRAVAMLRGLARQRPHALVPAVDRVDAACSLAAGAPGLLVELALAYYLPGSTRAKHALRDVVRGHEYLGPVARSQAAWYRGPFFPLLRAAPRQGMALISKLLAGALQEKEPDAGVGQRVEVSVDLLETGVRGYAGDAGAWAWYQGALAGPQPCMSALMALERWLESQVAVGSVSVRQAARVVVERVGTVAGAGLAYGLLARHRGDVTDELDAFLALPVVWQLENGRVVSSQAMGRASAERTPMQVAMDLVIAAAQREDNKALARLKKVAERLRAAGAESADRLAVGNWAAHLDWECYVLVPAGDQMAVEVRPTSDIARELEQRRARSAGQMLRYELQSRYACGVRGVHRVLVPEPCDIDRLKLDLSRARSLAGSDDGTCALAAAVVVAAAQGRPIPAEDMRWSLDLLAAAATAVPEPSKGLAEAVLPWDARRLAALALPLSLLPAVAAAAPPLLKAWQLDRLGDVVLGCAADPVHEVRDHLVEGMRPVWSAACVADRHRCHHVVAWECADVGVRLVVQEASRVLRAQHAARPPVCSLEELTGEEGVLAPLGTVVPLVLEAARTRHCRTAAARRLRAPLLEAYARTACSWAEGHYERRAEEHSAVAAALLRTAVDEPEVLTTLADQLAVSAGALSHLLHGMKMAAAYEPELVPPLAAVWPYLMESVLTRPAPHHGDDDLGWLAEETLFDELVPSPAVSVADVDVDGTLRRIRGRWLSLTPLTAVLEAWTTAEGAGRFTTDTLISLLKTQPVHEQIDPGLRWVRQRALDGRGVVAAPGFLLAEWLRELHPLLTNASRPHYQALVDGLALYGHPETRGLQQLDE
ncbi:hypothetical protein ACFZCY_45220 [Streptomyces sp. NPDC007983]|uniref:hypothetical protein n=1 Tax=Streptomyces sp. NPDC007983 TaxID=3364800 RepID=UPI0036E1077F